MTYDPVDGFDLLFGGEIPIAGGAVGTYRPVNDTWAFNSTTNTWSNLSLSHSPRASDQWAVAFDSSDGYVIAFGGGVNQTWKFQHGEWSQLFPTTNPPARSLPCLTYDSEDGYLLMFGGYGVGSASLLGDTWSFAHGQWAVRTGGAAPPPSGGCSLQDIPSAHFVLEFGGYISNPSGYPASGQTWKYLGGSWTELQPVDPFHVPAARWGAMVSFLPSCGCIVLFGGFAYNNWSHPGSGMQSARDTWVFEHGDWFQVSTNATPGARGTGSFAYDGSAGELILFGGMSSWYGPYADTWAFLNPLSVTLSASSRISADVGQRSTLTAMVSGAAAPVYYSWTGLPPECSQASGQTITCAPSTPLVANVTLTATDANHLQAVLVFPLTVSASLSVSVHPSTSMTDVGRSVLFIATAVGGSGSDWFSWQGLESRLGCEPSVWSAFASTVVCLTLTDTNYVVSATATDQNGATVSSGVALVVVSTAPVVTVDAQPAMVSLSGTVTITVSVTGGTGPYSFTYASLPPGCLAANQSVIHCKPSSAGAYSLGVTVKDAAGSSTNSSLNIFVQSFSPGPFSSLSPTQIGIFAVAFAAIAAIGSVLWRRRRAGI